MLLLVRVLTMLVLNKDGMASARNDTDLSGDGHGTFLVQTINILSGGRIIMLISGILRPNIA